jgi:enoyl-CoA hydratase
MSHTVLHEVHDKMALVTLNPPAKPNPPNYELVDRLMELPDEIERNDAIRVVVLTGCRRTGVFLRR